MGYKSTAQLALIGVGILFIFMYIRPTFAEIGLVQDELAVYREAVENAEEFNRSLEELVLTANSYSASDRQALDTFLPAQIDTAQVMRDIESLLEDYEIKILEMSAEEEVIPLSVTVEGEEVEDDKVSTLIHQDFTVEVAGDYQDLKEILSLLEANAYPIEVVELTLQTAAIEELYSEARRDVVLFDGIDRFKIEMVVRVHAITPNVN